MSSDTFPHSHRPDGRMRTALLQRRVKSAVGWVEARHVAEFRHEPHRAETHHSSNTAMMGFAPIYPS